MRTGDLEEYFRSFKANEGGKIWHCSVEFFRIMVGSGCFSKLAGECDLVIIGGHYIC